MSFRSLRYLVPIVAVAGFLAPWGCSASTNDNEFTTNSTTTSVGPGTGGAGGAGQGGSGNTGQGGFVIGNGGSGQGGGTVDPDAACAATSTTAEIVPLDMIVLLDQSGSMSIDGNWTGAVNALTNFINAPSSAGINMGLQYFPPTTGDQCNWATYVNLDVGIGELPMNTPLLINSLNSHSPNGGTPMYAGLRGVLAKATAYQDLNPTHKVIVVLASDGDPGACSGLDTIANIVQVAASALSYNGVQTYVIAIQGSTLANLNQIAAAGGTGQAIDVTSNINAFQQAMQQIQSEALSCEFPIPPPPDGQTLDLGKVALKFTDGVNPEVELPRADEQNDCGVGPGWYYNRPIGSQPPPDRIFLCPSSCSAVQASLQATVNVYFGCEPDVN